MNNITTRVIKYKYCKESYFFQNHKKEHREVHHKKNAVHINWSTADKAIVTIIQLETYTKSTRFRIQR